MIGKIGRGGFVVERHLSDTMMTIPYQPFWCVVSAHF